jgi:DNA replication protein DnaC
VGKTYLASALGMAANRNFHAVRYIRLPELLAELAIARGDGTRRKVMKKYKQIKLLILDEYLLFPLKESEVRDLLEIMEARHKVASTIFCHSLPSPGGMPRSASPRCLTPSTIVSCTIPIPSR